MWIESLPSDNFIFMPLKNKECDWWILQYLRAWTGDAHRSDTWFPGVDEEVHCMIGMRNFDVSFS